MSKDNEAKPTTVGGWIKYYQERGEALEGVSIDPETGERTMLEDLCPEPGEITPEERAWIDDYTTRYPHMKQYML